MRLPSLHTYTRVVLQLLHGNGTVRGKDALWESGSSCREDDESEALGAELLREAVGVRRMRDETNVTRRSDEGDTGTP